jgi:hypothetical protein
MDIRTFVSGTTDSAGLQIERDIKRPASPEPPYRATPEPRENVKRQSGAFVPYALRRIIGVCGWMIAFAALVGAILLAGIGIAAIVASRGTMETWNRWGAVGQSFESINAVFSGLAFVALVVTFWMQFGELQMQRTELEMQRHAMNKSNNELHRSAEADLRRLHMELIKMSIADPQLAEVWPAFEPGLTVGQNRQYLFANLIYQHFRLALQIGDYQDEEVHAHLRYMFSSPLMCAYWAASAHARTPTLPDTEEGRFMRLADTIYRSSIPDKP